MNKVEIIGNVTKDLELKQVGENSVCSFDIAVNSNYTDKDGNRVTDYFKVTCWNKTAENCCKYLSKGKKVAVVGSLKNNTYEDKNGVKRYETYIEASEIEFLTPKENEGKDKE